MLYVQYPPYNYAARDLCVAEHKSDNSRICGTLVSQPLFLASSDRPRLVRQ